MALRHGWNRKYDSLPQRRTCSFVPERILDLASVIARLDPKSGLPDFGTLEHIPMKLIHLFAPSPAGLTRGSIFFA
jgi:hypothetical protein